MEISSVKFVVVSAPSGAGKTSLVRALVDQNPRLKVAVSHTTRKRRPDEEDGVDYHFVDEAEFARLQFEGEFLESALVYGNHYGTTRQAITQTLTAGRDCILEIDWQGARQIKASLPDSRLVFILPPSRDALRTRLRSRGQDDDSTIERRMKAATAEMSHYLDFDYLIVNDDFETALHQLDLIMHSKPADDLATDRQKMQLRLLIRGLLELVDKKA